MSNVLKMAFVSMMCSLVLAPMTQSAQAKEFSDAELYVMHQGIMSVDKDGEFHGERTLNRAELVKIAVAQVPIVDLPIDNCKPTSDGDMGFTDVPADIWFAPYVCMAKQAGLITGFSDGTFRGGDEVTFVQGVKVLLPVLGIELNNAEYTHWFESYVTYLSTVRAIPTSITSLVQPMTRSEVAEVIYRVREHITTLESNSYSPESVCILAMQGRFYGTTQHDVYFYMPQYGQTIFGSGGVMVDELSLVFGKKVEGADAHSWQVLDLPFYGKDKKSAYYMGEKLKDADALTFMTLDTQYGYAKDSVSGYYQGQKVLGSDAQSFEALGNYYAKDKNHVYHFGQNFDVNDVATFDVLTPEYAADAVHAYHRGEVMMESEGDSFVVKNVSFAVDRLHAFYEARLIDFAMPQYFDVLKDHFSRDLFSVFFETQILEGVDPDNFIVLEDYYGKTKETIYYGAMKIDADVSSFQVLDKGYAKDIHNAYFRGEKINADPVSLQVSFRGIARDKDGMLYFGKHTY